MTDQRNFFLFPRDSTGTRGAVKTTSDGSDFYVPTVIHGSDGATPISAANPLPVSFLVMPQNAAFSGVGSMTKTYEQSMFGFVIKNKHTASLTFTIDGNSIEVEGGESFESTFNPFTEVVIVASGAFKAYAKTYPNFIDIITPEPVEPDTTAPENVTGLVVSNLADDTLTLSWVGSVSDDVQSYKVYNGATLLATVSGVTCNLTGLTPETKYTFTVKAVDSSNNYSSGVDVEATTTAVPSDITPPANVSSVSASNITQTGVTLTWTASASGDVSGYDVYNGGTFVTTVSAPTLTYNVTGLSASTQYTFTIKARDAVGNVASGTSASPFTTTSAADTTAPNPVTGLSAGTPTSNNIPLTWIISVSGDVSVQEVAYSTDGTNFTVASGAVNSASTSYTVTGLTASTAYTFRVVAIDGAGNRSTAVTTTATTAAPTGKVNDASLILYQDAPALNQTISSPDTYFQTNTQWTAFATVKPVLNTNAATKIFSRQTTNAILFEFTFANQFKCALYGHTTNGTGSATFPAVTDPTARTDFTGYYHVVIMRDGTKLYLYVNDTLVNSVNVASDVYIDSSTAPLLFGSHTQASPPIFKNMGYYNRALTVSELTQNYNALK